MTMAELEQLWQEYEADHPALSDEQGRAGATSIAVLLPAYERFLRYELQRAPSTITAYLSDLRKLCQALDKPVADISKHDLRGYMLELGEQGRSRATVRRSIGGLSTFWKWLIDEGYVGSNATSGIVLPKVERKMARWLTEAELHRFVDTPDASPRNELAWKLLAWLGLRRNELRRLRVGDVSLSDGLLVVRNTKGFKDRTLPIPGALADDLLDAFADGKRWRDISEFLLPGNLGGPWSIHSFYAAFKAHAQAAGLPGITPHTLRHTLATHMSQRGVPLRVIQAWLGHQRIETTSLYLQVAPEFMKSALEKHVLNEMRK